MDADGIPSAGPLSTEEVDHFWREGWLIPRASLPGPLVESLRSVMERVIAMNPGVRPERLVSAHLPEPGAEGVHGAQEFFELARHPMLLDAVEQLSGPDICLWGCQVFCKPGGDGMEVPMHQDGHYWPIRPLATVSVWVALDRSTRENGCLQVVPRTHTSKGFYSHHKSDDPKLVLNQAITKEELDQMGSAIDLELEPGQISIHDVHLVHGSSANTSANRRAGVVFRYMPTTSVLERDLFPSDSSGAGYVVDWAKRPIFLLRGVDRSGRNVLTTCPQPMAGANL